jgi:hypothetical protein
MAFHHSDRGVQYLAMNYTQRLAEANLVPSVGSVGDSYDNALAETINGLYKTEVIWRQRSWPSASAVEIATLRWVDWFNNQRLFGPIGYIPPAEAEAGQRALCRAGQPLSFRDRLLQSGFRLGEGASREERSGCPPSPLATHAELSGPGRPQCLA